MHLLAEVPITVNFSFHGDYSGKQHEYLHWNKLDLCNYSNISIFGIQLKKKEKKNAFSNQYVNYVALLGYACTV